MDISVVEPHPDGWFVKHDATLEGGDGGSSQHQGIKLAIDAVLRNQGVYHTAFVYEAASGTLIKKPKGQGAKFAAKQEDMPYNMFLWGKDTGYRAGDKMLIKLQGMDFGWGDGEIVEGVDTAEAALTQVVGRSTESAYMWQLGNARLCEKPVNKGGAWGIGWGSWLFIWMDRFVGPSRYDAMKVLAALAPQFALFDRTIEETDSARYQESKQAADSLEKLAFAGDQGAAFGICCRLVTPWTAADELASCAEMTDGMSGAKLFSIERRAGGEHGSVVIRFDSEPDERCHRLFAPGKYAGTGNAFARAMSESPYFPTVWTHRLLDNTMVLERLSGSSISTPGGIPSALCNAEDAVAFGTAVAHMHNADRAWLDECIGSKRSFEDRRDEIAASEHGAAMLEALAVTGFAGMANVYSDYYCLGLDMGSTEICEFIPHLMRLLPSGSLLGRCVYSHLDLHDNNIMRREADGGPGDIVLLDFDCVTLAQAAMDLGIYRVSKPHLVMPSLDFRMMCAQAYIDATPAAVLDMCSRTSVEEVALDMELGAMMGDMRIAVLYMTHSAKGAKPEAAKRWLEERLGRCLECWRRANSDEELRSLVLRQGIHSAAEVTLTADEWVKEMFGQ